MICKITRVFDISIKQYTRTLRDIRTLFASEEDYYKLIKVCSAFNDNYMKYERKYESNGDKDKTLSIKEYLDKIEPNLNNLIDDHKTQGEWKIQLTMTINFISSKDPNETRTMHSKSNNIEIMIGNETDGITEELFESLLQKYQEGLEEKMNRSEFVFDSLDILYYKLHKINLNRGGSNIDSLKWLKSYKS